MRLQMNKTGLENVRKKTGKTAGQTALLVYCGKCSTEWYGHWKYQDVYDFTDEIWHEIRNIRQIKQCPICRAKLSKNEGFYLELDKEGLRPVIDVNAEFEKMRRIRNVEEEAKAEEVVEALCGQLDVAENAQYDSQKAQKILSTTDELKEYLQQVIKIEANIIMQRKHLMLLYVRKEENGREQIYYEKLLPSKHEEQIVKAKELCAQYKIELKAEQDKKEPKFKKKMPQKPSAPEYKTAYFFNRKRVELENAQMAAVYNDQLEKYKQKFEKYKKEKAQFVEEVQQAKEEAVRIAQEKLSQAQEKLELLKVEKIEIAKTAKTMPSPAKAEKELLKKEINEAEKMLKKLLDCRRALYDVNVVFPKYQNMVAVSTFYEYLCAGRCETLEGACGAYNLYETETRANVIISQLNQVVESLEQIKNNQFTIYKQLQEVNATIDMLFNKLSTAVMSIQSIECDTSDMKSYLHTVSHNSSVIAYNTEVAAHYAKINAELTNSLGYLIALN